MAVMRLTAAEVVAQAERALELEHAGVSLLSPEGLSASVRRAASFLCPTTPSALRRAIEDALRGLGEPASELRSRIDETLRDLVGIGDLLVLRIESGDIAAQQLFLGTPAFVPRESGAFLIGVRPEGAPLIAGELAGDVAYRGHVRWITWRESDEGAAELKRERLLEISSDQWLASPRALSADVFAESFRSKMASAPAIELIDGLRVLDARRTNRYYRGRWRPATSDDTGYFVARRPQAYGADLWCLGQFDGSGRMRLVDLPIDNPLSSGADEAWRLQAALDALSDNPQVVGVQRSAGGTRLDLFSPLPSWAQRRLDLVGSPTSRGPGALFSYFVPPADADEEVAFLERLLWMANERS
jgi:hypothetical protein